MTPQEAIQNLNQECAIAQHRCGCKINRTDCESCYIWTAIKALEKQIPKKQTPDMRCPNCGHSVYNDSYKFCMECGQAIDWSDNNG